jgi:hypothetical protein
MTMPSEQHSSIAGSVTERLVMTAIVLTGLAALALWLYVMW